MHILLALLDMSSSGNTWEGWVGGWLARHALSPPATTAADTRACGQARRGGGDGVRDGVRRRQRCQAHVTITFDEDRVSTRHSENNQPGERFPSHAGFNYTSEEESYDDIPDEKQVDLGSVYSQCRAAREAAFVSTVVDISCNENMLSTETKKWDWIGTLDKQLDSEIKDYFKGARIEKNGVTVNQFLSCSFDLSTLLCITCGREHKVLEGEGGPDCFAVTDQNFISTLPGTDQKKCLHILRIENSSLIELANIFIEVMEGKNLQPGICILVG
jgi:hypothetical protein